MKKFYLLIFFSILLYRLNAQSSFADKCIGLWQGEMYMFKEGIVKDSVDIRFTVEATKDPNAWVWKMEYVSPKYKSVKDYLLKLKDKEKNHYVIDEKDGIELNAYLFENNLQSIFETEGTMLTSSYTLENNKLLFTVSSGKKIEEAKNGVINYSISHLQKVSLHKIK